MDKLLPIESGCKCLAFDPDLTEPQECFAVEFIPARSKPVDLIFTSAVISDDLWVVDRPLRFQSGYCLTVMIPKYLMRIDGNEDLFKQEQHDTTIPKKETHNA